MRALGMPSKTPVRRGIWPYPLEPITDKATFLLWALGSLDANYFLGLPAHFRCTIPARGDPCDSAPQYS